MSFVKYMGIAGNSVPYCFCGMLEFKIIYVSKQGKKSMRKRDN